jgi:hypothetical protein
MDMFLAGSNLTPINENIDKIVYGLTKWEPKTKTKGVAAPPMVTVSGKDYREALTNMNFVFLKKMWSDGLPLVPATEEQVNWILTGTALARDKVVGTGKILPRGGIATVESLAVALAMAGGRPEYLPVLIAAVEAFTITCTTHGGLNATTCSNVPAIIVNGPMAKQIRLNSGYGLLGPDPQRPANGPIGRAIRIILQDMGGGITGIGTMAIYGANRFTNLVFAEDEAGIPKGWTSVAEERGFPKGSNVVTNHFPQATINMVGADASTKEVAMEMLNMWSGFMAIPSGNYFSLPRWETGAPGILLVARGTAKGLADLGMSKQDVRQFLWEKARIPYDKAVAYGMGGSYKTYGIPEGQPLPVSKTPKSLIIVVCGGEQSGHAYFMSNQGHCVTSAEIKLPAKDKWDALLAQAEKDLGPTPP